MLALIVLLQLAVTQPKAQWKPIDTGLLLASSAALAVDWFQTIDISRARTVCPPQYGTCYPQVWPKHVEGNPILGDHPSVGRVNTYFATMLGLNLLAHKLPSSMRRPVWAGVTILESIYVARNHTHGVQLNFRF